MAEVVVVEVDIMDADYRHHSYGVDAITGAGLRPLLNA